MKNRTQKFLTLALILVIGVWIWGETAVYAANFTVTPNTPTWASGLESGTDGTGTFVNGPGSPPAGSGSFEFILNDGATGVAVGSPIYSGTLLSDINALSYSTYRTSGSAATAPAFQINIDYDITDGNLGWQGRLVFEPYQQGSNPQTGVWETWDMINAGNGVWWSSGSPGNGVCPQSSPCTWNDVITNFPNAGVHPTLGGMLFKAGSGWAGFQGNIDNFSIDVGGTVDNYDFEPAYPVHNITQATDHLTIQDGINNATSGDVITVDPGIYEENVVIDRSLTLRGSGAGTISTTHTIIDGENLTGIGININTNVTDVTIEDLRVEDFEQWGIRGQGSNDNFTAQNLEVFSNGRPFTSDAGLYLNGPVDSVLINNVTAHSNQTRGIVIWNGFKTNITITNNDVRFNGCCGIELQDGTASGVTMSNNVSINNGDSGMSAVGLTSGAGANVISGNHIESNGRFGLEIKNPNGTGATSGDGSIVIEGNTVAITATAGMNNRDHAGIAVFRRGVLPGNSAGYPDVPTGVVIRNNDVTGYVQASSGHTTSEGFGIVIEGTNHSVLNNTIQNNEIGIQEQGGNHPNANYTPNDSGDGDQTDGASPNYFGRGNAPIACNNTISGNTLSGNTTDYRQNVAGGGGGAVVNVDTAETFCSIQDAIDDTDTINGHTITVTAGIYTETVNVNKSVTLQGPNVGTAGNGARGAEAVINGGVGTAVSINANNVTLNGFEIQGTQGVTATNQTNPTISNNLLNVDVAGVVLQQMLGGFTLQDNAINLSQQSFAGGDAIGEQTIGVAILGVANTVPTMQNNDIDGAFYGYLGFGWGTGSPTTITGGTITGVMQGIAILNTVDGFTYAPSNFAINNTTMSGFTGTSPLGSINFHAGVYAFTGGGTTGSDLINGTLTNVDVDGTGNPQTDASALYFGDFGATGNAQTITVNGGNISNNLNRGLFARGNATVTANNVTFTNNGTTPASGNGYGVIAREGATITVRNSNIANGGGSAYAFHTSVAGSTLNLIGNTVSNGNLFQINSGTNLLAYANNITSFGDANLDSAAGTVNARHNWWGDYTTQPTGVDADSWNFRLGADVGTYTDGTGSVSIADGTAGGNASLTGNGTLVMINHGAGLANAPFGKAIASEVGSAQCSDFYDAFAIGGSGSYTLDIPVNPALCATGVISDVIYEFDLEGDGSPNAACSPDTDCWVDIPATRGGNTLSSSVPNAELLGTPFVAPSVNNLDPTAVTLQTTTITPTLRYGLILLILLAGLASVSLWWRRRTS